MNTFTRRDLEVREESAAKAAVQLAVNSFGRLDVTALAILTEGVVDEVGGDHETSIGIRMGWKPSAIRAVAQQFATNRRRQGPTRQD